VIAGRFGFEAALVCGAVLALAAGVLGFSLLSGEAGDPVVTASTHSAGLQAGRTFGLRFITLLLGVTVPMNAATAIFVWYLAPLILAGSGSGPAEIARVMMLYYLATVVFGSMVSRLADGRKGQLALVTLGAAASGAALLLLTLWGGFWGVVSAVTGLGVGHAMMRGPSYSLAVRITGGSRRALSALRGIERLGAFAGLAASALLLVHVDALASIRALGILVLCGIVLFLIVERARP
jgi:predicted MFS family arabinose efflux permease